MIRYGVDHSGDRRVDLRLGFHDFLWRRARSRDLGVRAAL
jgi:hypothetical protein